MQIKLLLLFAETFFILLSKLNEKFFKYFETVRAKTFDLLQMFTICLNTKKKLNFTEKKVKLKIVMREIS